MPSQSGSPLRESPSLLGTLGLRVRALRLEQGWTRRELARRSGVSVRYLARVESGSGNLSVRRLEDLARALETTADRLLRRHVASGGVVALVGLRGAGKSTVGPLLASRLGWPFLEMDRWIGDASGLPLDQLFELHGEPYYRRLEREAVRAVVSRGEPSVVAAAGGVVTDPDTWRLLREGATTVWLRAAPEDHWLRVASQGDRRPMANHPAAMDELRAILAAREPLYAQARIVVDTRKCPVREVVETILARLAEIESPV